ncbi:MAG: hypothetical protein IJY84_06405 [Clostridia bacterium]|nr:hypothetical protein [Clostridia bacterium]
MENKFRVKDTDIIAIKELAEELKNFGVDGYEYYYQEENSKVPFFKITKPFKKEKDSDPDEHEIFIDIDLNAPTPEYTVCGLLCHEHFLEPSQAVRLVKGMIDGIIAEVGLVYHNMKASFFIVNRGEPQKNVATIDENAQFITQRLFEGAKFTGFHNHILFNGSFTNYLYCDHNSQLIFKGVQVYLVSAILGEHPEYYIIQ